VDRDELIYKWLNHELDAEEFNAFKQLKDYQQLMHLNEGVQGFKASDYRVSEELQTVLARIDQKKSNKKTWLPIAASIAAVFIVCFGYFYYSTTTDSTFKTLAAQKESVELPDGSSVELNALSELSFNANTWNDNREVQLKGEAFFKVAKGSKFEVQTDAGKVIVLGTQFNVKQRNDFFEVVCYEGLVNVIYQSYNINVSAGNSFLLRNGKLIAKEKENSIAPSWTENYSMFKSAPLIEVLREFERQYDVKIDVKGIDTSQLFTGSFSHNDIEVALKSITLPSQLTYNKTNHTIILKRE